MANKVQQQNNNNMEMMCFIVLNFCKVINSCFMLQHKKHGLMTE